jgi:hypothetical protein
MALSSVSRCVLLQLVDSCRSGHDSLGAGRDGYVIIEYGASGLKPTRRQAPLGGDDDECLLVDHHARTLENLISRPLNKMRSVSLRCELPPIMQSRDVLKESRPRIEKAWTTSHFFIIQGPHHFAFSGGRCSRTICRHPVAC